MKANNMTNTHHLSSAAERDPDAILNQHYQILVWLL